MTDRNVTTKGKRSKPNKPTNLLWMHLTQQGIIESEKKDQVMVPTYTKVTLRMSLLEKERLSNGTKRLSYIYMMEMSLYMILS